MSAFFRICGNESQPGLQLVKRLVTPLVALVVRTLFLFTLSLYKQEVPKEQDVFIRQGPKKGGVRARGGDFMPETIPLSGFWSCEATPGSGHLTLTDRSLVSIQKR